MADRYFFDKRDMKHFFKKYKTLSVMHEKETTLSLFLFDVEIARNKLR